MIVIDTHGKTVHNDFREIKENDSMSYIISKCNKLFQKENKNSHEWVGKLIHWEL